MVANLLTSVLLCCIASVYVMERLVHVLTPNSLTCRADLQTNLIECGILSSLAVSIHGMCGQHTPSHESDVI